MAALVEALLQLAEDQRLGPNELSALLGFLTETGHLARPRRQEWVLLADVMGLSERLQALDRDAPAGGTPQTGAGPFYRPDAPLLANGDSICRTDPRRSVPDTCLPDSGLPEGGLPEGGRPCQPLEVSGTVRGLDGAPLPGAMVET